jgi:hypothetical protein
MPIVLTAAEATIALTKGGADIVFLLGAESVDIDTQAKLFSIGVTDVPKFSVFAKDETELTELLRDEFGLDKTAGLAKRAQIGNILIAFQRAQSRTTKEAELEAEFAAKRMTRPLRTTEYGSMRTTWEAKWWHLDDKQCPSRSYLEERCDQLESGDFHVEALSKVVSREEDIDPAVQTFFDGTGKLQIKKGCAEVALPMNPEQLRARVKIWGIAIMMLGMKHANQGSFQGLTPQHIENYLGYLLGDYCFGLTGRCSTGETVSAPSWAQLLLYENQIRKTMYGLMMEESIPAPVALQQAWKDPVVKERHFTTPVALSASNKKPWDSYSGNKGDRGDKGGKGGKGGNKNWKNKGPYDNKGGKGGRGKGEGKGSFSPGGKAGKGGGKGGGKFGECYSYNNHWERCTRANCKFNHVCSKCGGKHPVYRCTNGAGPETQGQGVAAQE